MVRMDRRGGTWKLLGSVVYAHSKVGLDKANLRSCDFTIIAGHNNDESESQRDGLTVLLRTYISS